jgi:hypothetical protein
MELLMRWLLVLVAACTPEIVPGAYFCGTEQLCPEGLACNGADNTCIDPTGVVPFACDAAALHEPDDTPTTAFAVPTLACVSPPFSTKGCLAAGNAANWLQVATPSNCASVAIDANIIFPLAFEPLELQVVDVATGAAVAADTTCTQSPGAGQSKACLHAALQDGRTYALGVAPIGAEDCAGSCNYNRYNLTLQLASN